MNTLFSLSEANLFAQLVDLLDAGQLSETLGYRDLHRILRMALDEAHNLSELKPRIMADPDRFVEAGPRPPADPARQKIAGKRLLLITNSDLGVHTVHDDELRVRPFAPGPHEMARALDLIIVEARSRGSSGAPRRTWDR